MNAQPRLRHAAADNLLRARRLALTAVILAAAWLVASLAAQWAPAPAALAGAGAALLLAGRAFRSHAGVRSHPASGVAEPLGLGVAALAAPAAALPLLYAVVVQRSFRPRSRRRAVARAAAASLALAAALVVHSGAAAGLAALPHAAALLAAALVASHLAHLLRHHDRLLATQFDLTLVCEITRLPNRKALTGLLRADVARAVRRDEPLAVLMLEPATPPSPAQIALMAEQLTRVVRGGDVVAHMGRGRFAIVAADARPDDITPLAERARRRLEVPVAVGGASLTPGDADAMHLLAAAEDALARARSAGAGRVVTREPRLRLAA